MSKNVTKASGGAPTTELDPPGPRPEAVVAAEDAVMVSAPTAALTVPRFLRKFSEISLMAAFLGAVLTYQLSLPPRLIQHLNDLVVKLNGGTMPEQSGKTLAIFVKDFLPFVQASVPVLEVKTTVWLMIALILVGGHFCGRLYETFMRVPVFPVDLAQRPKRDWYRQIPFWCIIGFLLWSAISFSALGWGPLLPEETEELLAGDQMGAVVTGGGLIGGLASFWNSILGNLMGSRGGSFHSFVAWIQVAAGLLFFLVAEDVIRTRRLVYKILGLILALGILASLVSILIHARAPLLTDIWVKWAPSEYRNDVGGFIGHNTAVSSFIIAPFLLAFTLLMAHRYRTAAWVRALLVVGLVLMGLTLILAQSRAVIPILFLAFLSLLVLLSKRATLRPGLTFWVSVPLVILVLLMTQFVRHDYNPFFRRSLPLETRIKHLSADHLRSETRLRMILCSLPVIGDNFLLGTSFGSFHYVFPEAQGEYFADHPDSFLVPTDKKSFHAHNEYLQTLFETGIVGFGLAMTGLVMILIGGWKALESSFRQRHIAVELAIFVSLLALLAHAFVDFPLRIAPIACTIVLLLAIWSAGDRLWLIPVVPLAQRKPGGDDDGEDKSTADFDGWKAPQPVTKGAVPVHLALAWVAVTVLLSYGVVLGGAVACQWFASSTLTLRGSQLVSSFLASGEDAPLIYLSEADKSLRHATMLTPLMGETDFHRGHARYARANTLGRMLIERMQSGAGGDQAELRHAIIKESEEAIYLTNRSLSEFKYHGSYRQRAGAKYQIAITLPGEMRPQAEVVIRDAIADLERSVLMNPGDPETINLLIRWKQDYARAGEDELRRLYFMIYNFHPWYFEREVLGEQQVLYSFFRFKEAHALAKRLLQLNPEDPELRRNFVSAAVFAGELEAARVVNETLLEEGDPSAPLHSATISVLEGNYDRALYYLALQKPGASKEMRDYYTAMRVAIRARSAEAEGDEADAATNWAELRKMAENDPMLSVVIAWMLNIVFEQPGRAHYYLTKKLESTSVPNMPSDFVLAAEISLAPHNEQIESLIEARGAAIKRGEEPPQATNPAMQKAIREAIMNYERALPIALTATERNVIVRQIRRLSELVPPVENGE